ncbi:response regulator [bacterium]|nr:response regulator [bacterium]NUN44244.1 response regulator [bacterium]
MKDHILVVDDELDAVDPLIRVLQHDGYEVDYAANAKEALGYVKTTSYQLILMDVMMPGMSGYQLLKKLQEDEETAYIPVIFVTGHFNAEEIVKGLEAGAVDAISKPFHIAEVVTRGKVRIAESKLKRRYTPIHHFFAEAQEKEQSRRTGCFEFFDKSKNKVGDVFVSEGKIVYATSKNAIKEDAFLQLASMKDITYIFQEGVRSQNTSFSASVTSLILEASKIVDELEAKEIRDEDQKRVLVIDRDRIPRILASRALKSAGYAPTVTSPDEVTQDIISKYDPHVVIVDPQDCELVLNKVALTRPSRQPIPLIVYGDQDQLEKHDALRKYHIKAFVDKAQTNESLAHAVFQALK